MPLGLHAATNRFGSGEGDRASTNRFSVTVNFDHYVRVSLTDMIFCGVFERYPRLQIGAVEHEVSWTAHFLDRMDYNYTQRARGVSGYRFKDNMLPSDLFRRNIFLGFQEDGLGIQLKPESTDGRREGWTNWDEGACKGESLGSIGTDVTRQRVFSSLTGPGERSMEAGNRVIARSDAAGCIRGPGGREFGGVGLDADSAVRQGVGWLAVGPRREWPAQPKASPGEDAK